MSPENGESQNSSREAVFEKLGEKTAGKILLFFISHTESSPDTLLTLGAIREQFADEDVSGALAELLKMGHLAINRRSQLDAEQIATLPDDMLVEHGDTIFA